MARSSSKSKGTDKPPRKRRRFFFRRRTKPGASPGTIQPDPSAPRPVLRVVAYAPDRLSEQELASPADFAEFIGKWPVTWLDMAGTGDAHIIETVGKLVGIHSLALEDAVNSHQRPKVEDYPNGLFIVARMPVRESGVATEQVSFFLGKDFLMTLQERPGDCLEPVRERLRRAAGRIRNLGPDYLAYALLDATIDAYFPVLERLSDQFEELESAATLATDPNLPRRLLSVRHEVLTLRRAIWALRDMLAVLYRGDSSYIAPETRVYLRDCHDHTIQLLDLIESHRELANSLMEVYMSAVGNRMNEVMKMLTIIATVFIPLTFISSIYGMNFSPEHSPWNMPELHWYFGYPAAMSLMLVVGLSLLFFFHRKGWIGSPRRPPTDG